MATLANLLRQYDEERKFLRQFTIAEEDRAKYTSAVWAGEYRWFRSGNVVCLEKVRAVRQASG